MLVKTKQGRTVELFVDVGEFAILNRFAVHNPQDLVNVRADGGFLFVPLEDIDFDAAATEIIRGNKF